MDTLQPAEPLWHISPSVAPPIANRQAIMRRLGQGLLWIGATLGAAIGIGLLTGFHPAGLSWIMMVGIAKLAVASSFGLMAGGAVCLRLDSRARQRQLVSANTQSTGATSGLTHPNHSRDTSRGG